jgi:hypothetical protein
MYCGERDYSPYYEFTEQSESHQLKHVNHNNSFNSSMNMLISNIHQEENSFDKTKLISYKEYNYNADLDNSEVKPVIHKEIKNNLGFKPNVITKKILKPENKGTK